MLKKFICNLFVLSGAVAFAPCLLFTNYKHIHRANLISDSNSNSALYKSSKTDILPSSEATQLKNKLLSTIQHLKDIQARDGDFTIDFGVKGGELNETSRAPQKVDYYAISSDVGEAADNVMSICDSLSEVNPCENPTKFLGNKLNGTQAPLQGAWRLLFTTAADASFSKNSTRGAAKVKNIVDGAKGTITNVIDFQPKEDGKLPALEQLNVVIRAKAASKSRVELKFQYAKIVLNKLLFLPLFGRKISLYIPVPATFITRIIVFISRALKFLQRKAGEVKLPPKAYFDVLYLDEDLRIHKTGEENIFVQAKESWVAAKPLLD